MLLALATVVLAAPLLGSRWSWIAGALVVLTPELNQQMSLPTRYVALAALAVLALAAWWRAVAHGGDAQWFTISGLMAGGAVGVDPAAALLALPLAAALAWSAFRRREQRRFLLRGGAAAGLVALAVGGAMLLPTYDWDVLFSGRRHVGPAQPTEADVPSAAKQNHCGRRAVGR